MKSTIKILTAALLLLSMNCLGQGGTKFTGTWVLQEKTSLSGIDYANGVPSKIIISQAGDQLIIYRTSIIGAEGQDTTETQTLNLDGNAQITNDPHRKISVLTQYSQDHHGFSQATEVSAAGKPDLKNLTIKEDWAFSVDGKNLTIAKTFTNLLDPDDKWSMKGTYQKQ
jgi:nitrate reductase alpha subunit